MGLAVVLRPAEVADAPGVGAVTCAAWAGAYRGLVPDEVIDGLVAEQIAQRLADGISRRGVQRRRVVAVTDVGEVVGVGFCGPPRDESHQGDASLGELAVLNTVPAVWGTGVGQRLHDWLVAELRAAGYSEAYLWVLHNNARAQAFYRRNGWVPTGVTKVDDRYAAPLVESEYRLDVCLPG